MNKPLIYQIPRKTIEYVIKKLRFIPKNNMCVRFAVSTL
ncbi:MAG: hypothetical protein BAJALOKI3v1_780024 [Promethearchaeota archaeon]|nr:MAG: hypothetical protein BAJALOKI3v1_780024 [Candidatus Lokiarchaeota archaeon]